MCACDYCAKIEPILDGAYIGKTSKGWFFGFKVHALVHQATGVVLTGMLTPGNWDDQCAVGALARSTGGVLLSDGEYSGEDTFNCLYDEAGMLRVMPSDEDKPGLSTISPVRQQIERSFSSLCRRHRSPRHDRSRRTPPRARNSCFAISATTSG